MPIRQPTSAAAVFLLTLDVVEEGSGLYGEVAAEATDDATAFGTAELYTDI